MSTTKTLPLGDAPLYRVVVEHLKADGTPSLTRTFGAFAKKATAKQQASYRLNEATRNGRKARVRVDALVLLPTTIHRAGHGYGGPE